MSQQHYNLFLTCEHAGNKIPAQWKKRFPLPQKVLESHRGIDIGAKEIFIRLKNELECPSHIYENTRLLIELNRSLHHPNLFSEFSKFFSREEKELLIQTLYIPYRTQVEKEFKQAISTSKKPLLHLSIHSFTPVFKGEARNCDFGFLYDPTRPQEKEFCKEMADSLKKNLGSSFKIRMNYPYRGTADGFTTYLRKQLKAKSYIGIEIEVNQALASDKKERDSISSAMVEYLSRI